MSKISFARKGYRKDYSNLESFERIGYTWTKVCETEEYIVWSNGTYDPNGSVLNLEVWKKRYFTNPDGTVVLRAPSDEDFGTWGWSPIGRPEVVKKKVLERFGIALP